MVRESRDRSADIHRADVGHAERRRLVRLRPQPPGHRPGTRAAPRVRVRLRATGDPVPAAAHAASEAAGLRRGGGAGDRRDPRAHARARVRALHQLRDAAAGPADRGERRSSIRSWCRARRRDRCCSRSSARPRTRCCSPPRASGRAWTSIGEALSCVIVDKLPFASPGDPITAARLEAIGARGGDPFAEYQVPLAILTLQQGLGRLLRHRLDRGVLAVLDPRLRTMGYGRRFLESLPAGADHGGPGGHRRGSLEPVMTVTRCSAHRPRRPSRAWRATVDGLGVN